MQLSATQTTPDTPQSPLDSRRQRSLRLYIEKLLRMRREEIDDLSVTETSLSIQLEETGEGDQSSPGPTTGQTSNGEDDRYIGR